MQQYALFPSMTPPAQAASVTSPEQGDGPNSSTVRGFGSILADASAEQGKTTTAAGGVSDVTEGSHPHRPDQGSSFGSGANKEGQHAASMPADVGQELPLGHATKRSGGHFFLGASSSALLDGQIQQTLPLTMGSNSQSDAEGLLLGVSPVGSLSPDSATASLPNGENVMSNTLAAGLDSSVSTGVLVNGVEQTGASDNVGIEGSVGVESNAGIENSVNTLAGEVTGDGPAPEGFSGERGHRPAGNPADTRVGVSVASGQAEVRAQDSNSSKVFTHSLSSAAMSSPASTGLSAAELTATAVNASTVNLGMANFQGDRAKQSGRTPLNSELPSASPAGTVLGAGGVTTPAVLEPTLNSTLITNMNTGGASSLMSEADVRFRAQLEQVLAQGQVDGAADEATLLKAGDPATTKFSELQPRTNSPQARQYSASLATPVTDPEWGGELTQKITWMSGRGIQAAELHLNPADMGPVEVRISVQNDQTTVQFNVQNAGVRELLESNVHRLREMMDSNGVELAEVKVDAEASANQGFASSHQDADQADSQGRERDGVDSLDEADLTDSTQLTQSSGAVQLVDYYA